LDRHGGEHSGKCSFGRRSYVVTSWGRRWSVYLFNIVVVLLKFTLLDKRLLWLIGVPAAVLALLIPLV
jgi:hypothetical protein